MNGSPSPYALGLDEKNLKYFSWGSKDGKYNWLSHIFIKIIQTIVLLDNFKQIDKLSSG